MKKLWVALALTLAILAHAPGAYQVAEPSPGESMAIVVLAEPCVAERVLRSRSAGLRSPSPRPLKREATADLERVVEASQRRFLSSLGQDPAFAAVRVLHRETLLINSLVVEATAAERTALRSHPLVQGVYPNRQRFLLMDAAPALVEAPAAWQEVGGPEEAGLGIRIGLIDSGINQDHVMLQDPELIPPEGFPVSEPEGFATSKVIVARTFVKTEYGLRSQADMTPRDEIGHGSQVAGAAAGVAVNSPLAPVSGIAPRAFLGNYKVFGTPGRNNTTTTAAVIAAINTAVADGMDVINLSLGGPAVSPDKDPEQMTIAAATALGYVFAIAAGNAGPGKGSLTSPGTSPAAITVGASTNARTFGGAIELNSTSTEFPAELETVLAVAASGSSLDEEIGPVPVQSITALDPSGEACTALPAGSLAGSVGLIRRGECTFSVKAQNVLGAAGAAGMIVYNNVAGSPIAMDFSSNAPQEPAVMITKADGEALLEFLEANPAEAVEVTFLIQGDLRPFPTTPDVLAGFSGRGPGIGLHIKPDLTAPGVAVHTASNGSGFTLSANGTSFATPMVAGGAALLLQRYPSWSSSQIKSALVNSAAQVVTVDGAEGLVNQVGNGRLDLRRAFKVRAFLDPVSSSFGNIPAAGSTRRRVLVTNAVSETNTYELSAQVLVGGAAVTVTVIPEILQLGPLQSVEIFLEAFPSGPPGVSFEGALTLTASGHQGSDLRLPFWGNLIANSVETLLVAESSQEADFATVGEALAEAGPGDTIEIVDSGLYFAPLVVEFNRFGTRLDGLTLRAAEGQLPVLQVSTGPAVDVRNVNDVTLEGLLIRGMETGIKAENADVKILGCRVETAGQPSDQNGAIQLVDSRVHVEDSELTAGSGSGLVAVSSEVLARRVRIGSEHQGNAVHGILASPDSQVAVFDSEVVGSGQSSTGQGIRVSDSQVLVKGSRIVSSRGDLGDGVQALGNSQVDLSDTVLSDNSRAGVSSFNGAVATVWGSEIESNHTAGVIAHAASVRVRSSRLSQNSKGATAQQAGQLDIRDSILSNSQGDGVNAEQSQLTLINATVYGSGGTGVRIASTPALVANSILFQNQGGDLEDDGSSHSVTSNLVGDLAMAGESGNFAGNPRFANAPALDFSLTADSDAVDRGSDGVSLSVVDLDFHRRVVDGDGAGGPRVDVGALEFASDTAEPRILPVLTGEDGHFVGLAVASARSGVAPAAELEAVTIRAYSPDGSSAGAIQVETAALTQDAFLLQEKFPDLREGWVEILPAQKDLMSFALTGDSALTRMDGCQLEPARGTRLFFPEVRAAAGEKTTLFIVNPHDETLNVSLVRHADGGEPELLEIRDVPARGLLRTSAQELGVTTSGGYITVEGESPLFAMQLFGSDRATGGLLALDESGADSNLFGAQFVSGPEFETFLSLIHTGLDDVVVEVVVRSEAGDILASKSLLLAPNGHFSGSVRELVGLPDEVVEGWLAVNSEDGQLIGSISFQDPGGRFLASLPLQSQGAREFLLSHVAQTEEIFTGVTLLNVTGGTALISVEVFTREGVKRGTLLLELGTNRKLAFVLPEAFPQLGNQERGFIRIRSNRRVLGFELFGRHDLEFLSAVPQQTVTR